MFCALSRTPGASVCRSQNRNELQSEVWFGGRRKEVYFKDAVKGSVQPKLEKVNIFSRMHIFLVLRCAPLTFPPAVQHNVNVISFVVLKASKNDKCYTG